MRATATKKPDADMLFDFAEGQQGYFTATQAAEAGYARSTHTYHVQAGNWVREYRGIYRLRRYPRSEYGQLVLWSLWSRNRDGEPEGVYSHLSALSINDLSDANPAKLHMTVPPNFRRNAGVPKILVLYKGALAPGDILRGGGYAVTTPIRAVTDLAISGEADRDIINQALSEGSSRGLITRKQIAMSRARTDLPDWFQKLLSEA